MAHISFHAKTIHLKNPKIQKRALMGIFKPNSQNAVTCIQYDTIHTFVIRAWSAETESDVWAVARGKMTKRV